jgi:hypothetical protein
MPEFRKWRSINKFSDAYILANKFGVKDATYRGKIKLHGSNAGIQFEDGIMYGQKRTDFVTIGNDNAGFAQYVSKLELKDPDDKIIIYGEWAGPGIQKEDAVSSIPRKSFFVFSVEHIESGKMVFEPELIEAYVSEAFGQNYEQQNIYVIPWHTNAIPIDFQRQGECQRFIDTVMKEVDEVIAVADPYIKHRFDVEGSGEGLVMYATSAKFITGDEVSEYDLLSYMFKAKTEAHSVQKEKNRNHVAPEKPDGIEDFIEMFFTEARFQQMLNQIGGKAEREKTGQFMKAIMSDVYKESEQEVLISDFEWKDVPKYAAPVAKIWWFKKCEEL